MTRGEQVAPPPYRGARRCSPVVSAVSQPKGLAVSSRGQSAAPPTVPASATPDPARGRSKEPLPPTSRPPLPDFNFQISDSFPSPRLPRLPVFQNERLGCP